jgi:hypothetical protein
MGNGMEMKENYFDFAVIVSSFPQNCSVNIVLFHQSKVYLPYLKSTSSILSRSVCQGFQRTCHDVKGSGKAEKFWNMTRLGFKVVSLRKSFFEGVLETHPENNVKGSQFFPK